MSNTLHSWAALREFLEGARDPAIGRPMPGCEGTRVWYTNPYPAISVCYHGTRVVVRDPDGTCRYNTGGWLTDTTMCRMNDFGHSEVRIVRGASKPGVPRWLFHAYVGGADYLLMDGMTYHSERGMQGAGTPEERDHLERLLVQIHQYASRCARATPFDYSDCAITRAATLHPGALAAAVCGSVAGEECAITLLAAQERFPRLPLDELARRYCRPTPIKFDGWERRHVHFLVERCLRKYLIKQRRV